MVSRVTGECPLFMVSRRSGAAVGRAASNQRERDCKLVNLDTGERNHGEGRPPVELGLAGAQRRRFRRGMVAVALIPLKLVVVGPPWPTSRWSGGREEDGTHGALTAQWRLTCGRAPPPRAAGARVSSLILLLPRGRRDRWRAHRESLPAASDLYPEQNVICDRAMY